MRTNSAIVNFVGGEVSPKVHNRTEIKVYKQSVARLQNFLPLPQGPAMYRPGTAFVHYTRRDKTAVFIPFQYNDEQSYLIEATEYYFRFYKDNGIITESNKTITGVTKANPAVVTITSHGYSNGDEVFINDVGGMTELNGKSYLVASVTTNTFALQDRDGNNINSTSYTTYTSGGRANRIYEIITPYKESDLLELQYAQNTDTMFIACKKYAPRKLTRSGHTSWTLVRQTRTANPFTTIFTVNAITKANPAVVTVGVNPHNIPVGTRIYLDTVSGMTEVNNKYFLVGSVPAGNQLTLQDENGVNINSTSYGTFSGNANLEWYNAPQWPRAVAFTDDGRLIYGGTQGSPETLWGSQSPSSGASQYDNFTTGTADTAAYVFTLAPVGGEADTIQWITNSDKFLLVGTYSTIRRLYGGTQDEPLTPTAINAKSVNTFGAALASPVPNGVNVFYTQRGNKTLRSFEFDYVIDGYMTTDRNLIAEHLLESGIKSITVQTGKLSTIWCVTNSGMLAGMTFNDKEDISGWHRHYLGGSHVNSEGITVPFAKVLSVGKMGRSNNEDQLWIISERKINGTTRRIVGYLTDPVVYPQRDDFMGYGVDEDDDEERYVNAKYEAAKLDCRVDASLYYDGAATGVTAGASVTPGATSGSSVTFTASASVFTSAMVGRQIWKKISSTGVGSGRATITGYTSATQVTCSITEAFDSTSAMAAGNWFLTATNITGLNHLEGQTVGVTADGGDGGTYTVSNGAITLSTPVSRAYIGLPYTGILKTLNLDAGGVTGSAQSKLRNVNKVTAWFLDSGGAEIGTRPYDLEPIAFSGDDDDPTRPTPLFSGPKDVYYSDNWRGTKHVYVIQDKPVPCLITNLDIQMETTDEV